VVLDSGSYPLYGPAADVNQMYNEVNSTIYKDVVSVKWTIFYYLHDNLCDFLIGYRMLGTVRI